MWRLSGNLLLLITICNPVMSQQWKWLNPIPQGDRILQIQAVGTYGWMAVQSANLLRTTNGGSDWKICPLSVSLRRISFVDELNGWGIGSKHPFDTRCGVYRTTDGGATWEQQVPDTTEWCYDIKFTDTRNGWVLGQGMVWHTEDSGITWRQQGGYDIIRPSGGNYKLSFKDSLNGWAGGWLYSYASRTTNGGVSWFRDSTIGEYNKFEFVDSLEGWASSTLESQSTKPIGRTSNGGNTWFETSGNLVGEAFAITKDTAYAFANGGVYKTTNGGLSWEQINNSPFWLGFFEDNLRGWAAQYYSSAFYQTMNGGSYWTKRSVDQFGSGTSFLKAVVFVDSSTGWCIGGTSSQGLTYFVAKTTDAGLTWSKQTGQLTSQLLGISFANKLKGWVVGRGGVIRRTSDGGTTWAEQNGGTNSDLWDVQFLDSARGFAVGASPAGQPPTGVILKTSNSGLTWDSVSQKGLTRISRIQFVDSGFGWICGNFSSSTDSPVFLRTTDSGATWSNAVQDGTTEFESIFFVSRSKGWALAKKSTQGIYSTSDSGKTWSQQRAGYTYPSKFAFINSEKGVFVGGSGVIFRTTDGGNTWVQDRVVTSQSLTDVESVADSIIVVGDNGTVLKGSFSIATSVSSLSAMPPPSVLRLFPNYPNPFNNQTIISFEIGSIEDVRIQVFDILGRILDTMNLGRRAPGLHTLYYSPKNAISGVYFYRIWTPSTSSTGRFVLIK